MSPRTPLLSPAARDAALKELAGWQLGADGKTLTRRFVFADFAAAFAFMTRLALVAERLDHHPDWRNSYREVVISLSSHDAGGITSRDVEFAKLANFFMHAASPSART